jgi:hypothetical protein
MDDLDAYIFNPKAYLNNDINQSPVIYFSAS